MVIEAQESRVAIWHYTAEEIEKFHTAVDLLRGRAGLPRKSERPIREMIREGGFSQIRNSIHCDLFDRWPLRDQMEFLSSVAHLSGRAISVRIYDQILQLLRDDRRETFYE